MVERVLRQAGYRTGLYTSPFLQAYNERIRLDGAPVSDALLEQYGNQVLDAAEKLHGQGIQPTAFELGTALALLIFQAQQVDLMVIEVGLGGRLDPTNVITPPGKRHHGHWAGSHAAAGGYRRANRRGKGGHHQAGGPGGMPSRCTDGGKLCLRIGQRS